MSDTDLIRIAERVTDRFIDASALLRRCGLTVTDVAAAEAIALIGGVGEYRPVGEPTPTDLLHIAIGILKAQNKGWPMSALDTSAAVRLALVIRDGWHDLRRQSSAAPLQPDEPIPDPPEAKPAKRTRTPKP